MEKIALDPINRESSFTLSNEIAQIKRRYDAIINKEIKPAKDAIDRLYTEEKAFIEKAEAFLKMVALGEKLNVETQTNAGKTIRLYAGATITVNTVCLARYMPLI